MECMAYEQLDPPDALRSDYNFAMLRSMIYNGFMRGKDDPVKPIEDFLLTFAPPVSIDPEQKMEAQRWMMEVWATHANYVDERKRRDG